VDNLSIAMAVPYVPPTYIGGETYVYYLTKELAKLGVSIDLFTAVIPQKTGEWDWGHVNLHESSYLFKIGNTPIMPSLLPKLIKYDNYDLIHTTVPSGFACDVSAFVSYIKRKPLVILYHCDVAPSSVITKTYSSFLRLYTLRHADSIISTTRSYAETSSMLKRIPGRVDIVPLGVDTTRFFPDERYQSQIRERHGIGDDNKTVLFIGGLNWHHRFKRVDLLIRAMSEVCKERDDITLVIVGEGDLKPGLQLLCQELNLGKVIFTGYVSNDDLPKYCNAADLLVVPSLAREEAFGMVIVEAAACGAVPICFDIAGPSELCRDLGGFVCTPEETKDAHISLAETISRVLASNLEHKSTECAERAKKYSWTEIAQKTLAIYERIVK